MKLPSGCLRFLKTEMIKITGKSNDNEYVVVRVWILECACLFVRACVCARVCLFVFVYTFVFVLGTY